MAATLLVGNDEKIDEFIKNYIYTHQILPFDIHKTEIGVTIANAREIRRILKHVFIGNKLFILHGPFTIEAQNSLLKIVEESRVNIHFIFCQNSEDNILPTIISRCKVVTLTSELEYNIQIEENVLKIVSNHANRYFHVEKISEIVGNDLKKIFPVIRSILLDDNTSYDDKMYTYIYCKRLLAQVKLVENNNVSVRVILDDTFAH